MPVLKNARHERFAQAIASGATAVEAHKKAKYRGVKNRQNASEILSKPDVVQRIKELQEATAARAEVTQDTLLAECDTALTWATADKDVQGAIAVIRMKAQLTGLIVRERDNSRQPIADVPDAAVTDELARLRREREANEKKQGLH